MSYDQAFSRKLNDHVHGVTALTMPSGHRMRLLTAMGTPAAAGTEVVSGGGYVSGTGATLITYSAATLATPTMSPNDVAITISNWPRDETVVGLEIWDGTPSRIEYGTLVLPAALQAGDTVTFSVAAINSALS